MPNHNTQSRDRPPFPPLSLRILQLNLNKSEKAHIEFINNIKKENWDVVLVQEPHMISRFNVLRTPTNFRPVFPENRGRSDAPIRSLIWVSTALDTRSWKIVNIPDTNDLTAIQLKGDYGTLTIFNIYNDCNNSDTEVALNSFIRNRANRALSG